MEQQVSAPTPTPARRASDLTGAAPTPALSWPPPGLEPMQGRLWSAIRWLLVGGVVLATPLLWAIATESRVSGLGPFGGSWWVPVLTTLLGIVILAYPFLELLRMFWRARQATRHGYGWLTLAHAALDSRRDMGFLLQGARNYANTHPSQRRVMVNLRLSLGALMLAAGLWLPIGVVLSVLLAARGALSPGGMWALTLVPLGLLLFASFIVRIIHDALARAARRASGYAPPDEVQVQSFVANWNQRYEEMRGDGGPARGALGRTAAFGATAVGLVALGLLLLVPLLSLAFTTFIGPVYVRVSVPTFSELQQRAGAVELLRRYRVPADPAITPQQAGEALHSLLLVGQTGPGDPVLQMPVRSYPEPWFPRATPGGPENASQWVSDLLARSPLTLSFEERVVLQHIAQHPAHADISLLARAGAADVVATRWKLPFPANVSGFEIPIPQYRAIREAAYARLAVASLQLSEGRGVEAEQNLRDVMSLGFLLVDQPPLIIDNLVGLVIVGLAGEGLQSVYRATGRTPEAEDLAWARAGAARAAELAQSGDLAPELHELVGKLPARVNDPALPRGIRWEAFGSFNTIAPCMNPHWIVFGLGHDYQEWVEQSRASLVRFPGDEELFRLLGQGWIGTRGGDDKVRMPARLLGLTLGGASAPGSCLRLLASTM